MATYVISDLHSHLEILQRFLKDIKEDDRVYCLGDTIDKGPDGIKVLQYVMHHPQITLLMGNHELMMLNYLEADRKLSEVYFVDELYNYACEKDRRQKGNLWLGWNWGDATYDDYLTLNKEERDEIYHYLKDLPVMLDIEVNGRKFVLVHAMPYDKNGIRNLSYSDVENDIEEYVWVRNPYCHVNDHIVVVGHDIVQIEFRKWIIETDGRWYDIDMGLAMNNQLSRLAALRLDDMSVTYYNLNN